MFIFVLLPFHTVHWALTPYEPLCVALSAAEVAMPPFTKLLLVSWKGR